MFSVYIFKAVIKNNRGVIEGMWQWEKVCVWERDSVYTSYFTILKTAVIEFCNFMVTTNRNTWKRRL